MFIHKCDYQIDK